MNSTITYGELDALLGRIGFRPVKTAGPQKVFENPSFDALIVLPPVNAHECVRPHHLASVRRLVIEKGIADSATLERLIMDRTLSRAS